MVNIKLPKSVEKSSSIDHNARHPFLPIFSSNIDRTTNNNNSNNSTNDNKTKMNNQNDDVQSPTTIRRCRRNAADDDDGDKNVERILRRLKKTSSLRGDENRDDDDNRRRKNSVLSLAAAATTTTNVADDNLSRRTSSRDSFLASAITIDGESDDDDGEIFIKNSRTKNAGVKNEEVDDDLSLKNVKNGKTSSSRKSTLSSINSSTSSSSSNGTTATAKLFRIVPFGVREYFLRKKKSWPTLNVFNSSSSSPNNNNIQQTDSTDENDDSAAGGDSFPMTRAVSAAAAGGESPSSKNFRVKNYSREKTLVNNNNCQKRKISRLPSKEDPGPSRTHELIFNFEDANNATHNNKNNGLLAAASQNYLSQSILNAGDFLAAAGVQQQQQDKSSVNFWYNACAAFSQTTAPPGVFSTTKFKFVNEGQIQICRLNHARTVLGKLSSSKLLRRWETHFLILGDDEIKSKTASGAMEQPVKYALMEDVHALPQWDSTLDKFCIRIFIPEGSVLLQTNHVYTRNQWLYSIQWRRNLYRYRRIIELSSGRPEVLLKETKCLVEQVKCCPLQGDNLSLKAVLLISRLIEQIFAGNLPKTMLDPIIMCIAPLLDTVGTVTQVSPWLSMYCNDHPRSRLIDEVLSEVAQQTLKKTMDFGKYPTARIFVQDYLLAVSSQNNGVERIKNFVNSAHSLSSCCPHPRVLPNLVTVSLAAVHALYDQQQQQQNFSPKKSNENGGGGVDVVSLPLPPTPPYETPSLTFTDDEDRREKLRCFCIVFDILSEFEDWRVPLSVLLQPIPFPDDVLGEPSFARDFGNGVLRRLAVDGRCEIHLSLLGARENKEGWFHLVCPGGPVCSDDGELFSSMLKTLLHCCCRRKKFLQTLNAMLGPLQLLALRENEPSMEAICHMLEFEVVEGQDLKVQMITALQSTAQGKKHYAQLCDRQIALRELQQKGGPRKLTLPSKSTDSDLAVLLSSGSFGNLEWLSLAFTNVTSSCADYLIKLPSLRYLNLWSTQFGDSGLQLLSEHLTKLQVLNLCETPVTDKGLSNLSSLKSLRKLNLNSTQLSAKTFLVLKTELPALQEVDVRYTDAWCVEDALST